jgi:hypothetical protein
MNIMEKDLSGKSFENLSTIVFDNLTINRNFVKVEKNVWLDGQDGKRQIDILMTADLGPFKVKTIVECRDYGKILDVTHIDGLHSKMQDVGAHQAAIVTRKGYSGKARKKAKRLGISLFTLYEAKENDWEFVRRAPVFVKELFASNFNPSFNMQLNKETTFSIGWNYLINDIGLPQLFQNLLLQKKLNLQSGKVLEWDIKEIQKPHYVRDTKGVKVPIENVKVYYKINESLYFGYLSDLPGSLSFNDVLEGKSRIFIKAEALVDYREFLNRYDTELDFPSKPIINLIAVACPDFHLAHTVERIVSIENGGELCYTTSMNMDKK